MTRDNDFIGQLEGYLDEYEGVTSLPDAVRDAIRAELATTKQIGPLPGLIRNLSMSMSIPAPARYALVAAAVVMAAILGASFLGGDTGGPSDPTPTPIVTPLPAATPGALPAAASLAPGTYVFANPYTDEDPVRSCERGCSDYQSITFTVPDGWAVENGLIFKHVDQPNEVAFSMWTPGDLYLNPCRWETSAVGVPSEHTDNDAGEIVLDDQYALLNQVGRTASAPVNVTLGGQRTRRIELRMPADFAISACDQGEYRSWSEWDVPDGANSHHAPGQIDVVYFVDVDRRPLYIDASHRPDASAADLAELEAILASIFINRGF
jgi:hypothetical protein